MSEPRQRREGTMVEVPQPNRVLDLTMSDGAMIRVRRHGNPHGPRLVLSHGNGLAIHGYLPFWELLLDRYDVVLFDFRNHGENPLHGEAGHDIAHFVCDMDRVLTDSGREFGAKPVAAIFHSLSAVTAIRHALAHPDSWRALVLVDPPIFPRDGHPLRNNQQMDKDQLGARARRRTERYQSTHDFARQLAGIRAFKLWRPQAYELMARATLRHDERDGEWTLACPRELEARIFEESTDPSIWTRLAEVKAPVKLIGADPELEGAGPPALISKAIAEEVPIEYEAIAGTTHFLQIEKPEECLRAAESFLARHAMAA